MTYPYISTTMNNLLLYKKDTATLIGDESNGHSSGFKLKVDESKFENNTAEYLANTYGEVKSKEHAEFIVKLAEVNGIDFDGEVGINSNYFCFFPSNSKQLTFWRKEKDASKHGSRKQITIPLPPECESADEWPKVGDTVSLRYRFDSKQVMYTGELLYLSSNHIIIKTENGNDCHCIRSEWDIEKPKTPEQELRDFISLLWDENNHDLDMFLDIVAEHVVKKPQ